MTPLVWSLPYWTNVRSRGLLSPRGRPRRLQPKIRDHLAKLDRLVKRYRETAERYESEPPRPGKTQGEGKKELLSKGLAEKASKEKAERERLAAEKLADEKAAREKAAADKKPAPAALPG